MGRFLVPWHIMSVEKSKSLSRCKKGGVDYEKAF